MVVPAWVLDADDVVTRFGKSMLHLSITMGCMPLGIAIGSNCYQRAAIAKVPGLTQWFAKKDRTLKVTGSPGRTSKVGQ